MQYLQSKVPHLDVTLGVFGLPFSKIIEIFGGESAGKSTFIQSFMIMVQDQLDIVYYFDSENSFDMIRYKLMGGDTGKLKYIPIKHLEEFEEILFDPKKYGVFKKIEDKRALIIWDTLAGTLPKDTSGIQRRPQKIRELLARVTHEIQDRNISFIILNQVYENIGTGGVVSLGGRGLRHFAQARFHIKRIKTLEKMVAGIKTKYGFEVQFDGVKNKISFERLLCPLKLTQDYGIDKYGSIILFLQKIKALQEKSGGHKVITIGDKEYKFQQSMQFAKYWDEDEEFRNHIYLKTYEYYSGVSAVLKVKLLHEYNRLRKHFGLPEVEVSDSEYQAYQLYLQQVEAES